MPKYLFKVSYTTSGIQGVLKEGGSGRQIVAEELMRSLGGQVESIYFAFGDVDAYVIAELPDAAAAASASMRVSAGGGASVQTTALLEPSEIDEAANRESQYRPPGA